MGSRARPYILVVDDQSDVRAALRLMLKTEGWRCKEVADPQAALDALANERFDLALIDLNYQFDTTSGIEGLELLHAMKLRDPHLRIVILTAWGTISLAVAAMRDCASDFIEKPWDNAQLLAVMRRLLATPADRSRAPQEADKPATAVEDDSSFIAESPVMVQFTSLLQRIAPSDTNVLILGENGTGKSMIARRLHLLSNRRDQALVQVNMGGIPESVFEAEMFGHVRGAFTDAKADRMGRFELANGGTLFLDEIGSIPLAHQSKLLRVLEAGEFERIGASHTRRVDVRVLSATNADLEQAVAQGSFRQDLLFRLNTVELRVPPLRERGSDIVKLAQVFLLRFAQRYQRAELEFAPAALRVIEQYRWPGNVRELAHVIERAVLLATSVVIDESALALQKDQPLARSSLQGLRGNPTVEQAEEFLVREALRTTLGNVRRAAAMLGLSRAALYRRLEKYSIVVQGHDDDSSS